MIDIDHERLDQLAKLTAAQRMIVHRLYHEWTSACRVLNNFEREQSALFRKMMDGPALPQADGKSS